MQDGNILKSRTINRFNKYRNRIEHDYYIPKVEDTEVYFDLIVSLITIIKMALQSLRQHVWTELGRHKDNYKITIIYSLEKVSIKFILNINGQKYEKEVAINQQDEFARFFKIFYLLSRRGSINKDHLIYKL